LGSRDINTVVECRFLIKPESPNNYFLGLCSFRLTWNLTHTGINKLLPTEIAVTSSSSRCFKVVANVDRQANVMVYLPITALYKPLHSSLPWSYDVHSNLTKPLRLSPHKQILLHNTPSPRHLTIIFQHNDRPQWLSTTHCLCVLYRPSSPLSSLA